MPRYFGSQTQTYVGAIALPVALAGKIGDTRDYSFPQTPVKADRSSNDTGRRSAHGVARVEGDLSFKCVINRADPGQAILFAAVNVEATGTGMVFVEHHPEGTGSGRPRQTFEASVDIKPDGMFDQFAMMAVTLAPSGAITLSAQ